MKKIKLRGSPETIKAFTMKCHYDRPETLLLFQNLIIIQWRKSGMDIETATKGLSFYLGLNPLSPTGDKLSGYYYPEEKWVCIPKFWWDSGLPQDPFMLTVHHEMGHHVHFSHMGKDGSPLWQEWAAMTGKTLDFGSYPSATGRKEVPNTSSYEDFANDFQRTMDGRHKGATFEERRRFYFGLWGQTKVKKHIELIIGDRRAKVDGRTVELDVPAQVVSGRTLVPFRFIAEAFGAQVDYFPKDGKTEKVTAEMEVLL